jgi:hypothetical protein
MKLSAPDRINFSESPQSETREKETLKLTEFLICTGIPGFDVYCPIRPKMKVSCSILKTCELLRQMSREAFNTSQLQPQHRKIAVHASGIRKQDLRHAKNRQKTVVTKPYSRQLHLL